ncbi:hypothetical protein [Sphingobium sp. EM0848]|uniref:hypothetical protein n=1 Tax=Sphingobium sp. EM0848 TaxID=2743473 RepID=UPI001C3FC0B8|nr:hypothetical protein [Sphingobium sp. EM0848]
MPYPNRLIAGSPNGDKPFDENAWELYNLNEDYTERLNIAKRYPEKVAELRALFENEAQEHKLYPLITWDDVRNGRIHRTGERKTVTDEARNLSQHSGSSQ